MKRVFIAIVFGLLVLIGLAILFSSLFTLTPNISIFANRVAVIPVKGTIELDKPSFVMELSSSEIIERLYEAKDDRSIAAVLLEINSGGGSIVATKQVVAAIREVGEEKPVVAWIGDVGASGAYYIASASDYIVADEDSLTGSIGAVSVLANIKGLLQDLNIEVRVIKGGENKAMGSIFEGITAEQEEMLQVILRNAVEHFKRDVVEYRGERLNRQGFEAVADGRILSGEQALGIGMVDGLGTRGRALGKAGELAGLEQVVAVDYSKQELSLFDLFVGSGYYFSTGLKQGLTQSDIKIES